MPKADSHLLNFIGYHKVTQDTVHIFTPLKVSKIITKEISKKSISKKGPLINFYNSRVYDILKHEETMLWYESAN